MTAMKIVTVNCCQVAVIPGNSITANVLVVTANVLVVRDYIV